MNLLEIKSIWLSLGRSMNHSTNHWAGGLTVEHIFVCLKLFDFFIKACCLGQHYLAEKYFDFKLLAATFLE